MHAVYSVHFILYQYHSSFSWRLSPNDAVVTTPIGSILVLSCTVLLGKTH